MKPAQAAKTAARIAIDPFEALTDQVAKPIGQDILEQLGGFWGSNGIARRPQTLAQEDLKRAREKEKLDQDSNQDQEKSQETANQITISIQSIQNEYRTQQTKTSQEDQGIQTEVTELKAEIAKLAKTAGIDTKAHMQGTGKTSSKLEIKFLTTIIRTLRVKAEEAKSASELVSQRSNSKRTTGMLAWVSGKQMKVHEQGTLQLQG